MTLRQHAFRSGVVVTAASVLVYALRIGGTIALARLLDPTDFGLVALAMVLVGGVHLVAASGMGSALIATRSEEEASAHHAFVLTAAAGTALGAVVLLLAPPLASLLGRGELAGIFRALAVVVLLDAMAVVPAALLARALRFGRRALPQVLAVVVQFGASIVLAALGHGYWSLVAGKVAGSLAATVAALALCPTRRWLRPRRWDGALGRQLLRFGWTETGTQLVRFAYNHGDDLVVGRAVGAAALGFYTQAYRLANLPVDGISTVVNTVLLPAYARARDGGSERLAAAFLASLGTLSVLVVPLAAAMAVLAPPVVLVLLGAKWAPAIPILEVLAIVALVRPLSGATSPLFLALGRPGYNLRTACLQALVLVVSIPPLLPLGAVGVALAVALTFTAGFGHNLWLACRRAGLGLRARDVAARLRAPCLAAAAMAALLAGVGAVLERLADGADAWTLLLQAVLAPAAYGGALWLLDRGTVREVAGLVRGALRRRPEQARA